VDHVRYENKIRNTRDTILRILRYIEAADTEKGGFNLVFLYYDTVDTVPTILKDPHFPELLKEHVKIWHLSGGYFAT
jgi:hypothetical protein